MKNASPRQPDSTAASPTAQIIACTGALISAELREGIAIFSGYGLSPGAIRSARVRIGNPTGEARALHLQELSPTNAFATGELELLIDEVSESPPRQIYRGELGALPEDGLDLGVLEGGEEHTYRFLLVLDSASRPARGSGADARYRWRLSPLTSP